VFLPDCCNKCDCSCSFLPHTITLKFSGFESKMASPGGLFNGLIADSCFETSGTRALASISWPGGDASGPIEEAFVVSPGECYAEPGRVAPTLSASWQSGPAEFDIQLEEFVKGCRPVWKIKAVSVENGSTIPDGTNLSFGASIGDITSIIGTGKVAQSGGQTSVTLTQAGEYYRRVKHPRDIPSLKATATGGVRVRATTSYNGGDPPTWSVSGLAILHAGSGLEGDKAPIKFTLGDRVKVVDDDNAEAYLTIDGGKAKEAFLVSGGTYYRDTDVPPVVADVTFSPGAGKVLRGIVDDDPGSSRFGQVIDVEVEEPGDNHKAWSWNEQTCATQLNGRSIVLRANDWVPLVHTCTESCSGGNAVIEPIFRVKPLMVGEIDSLGRTAHVYLEENEGYPKTWGVSRVEGFGGAVYEVGQKINVAFLVPVPANEANFYDTPSSVAMRTKTEVPAVVTVAEIELPPADAEVLPQDWPYGHIKAVTITEPGAYYQESNQWDGVETPLHHVRLVRRGAAYARMGRTQPDVVVQASSGPLDVTLAKATGACDLPVWGIDSISPAGSAYEGQPLTFQTSDNTEVAAYAIAHTREQPTVNVSAPGGSATLTVSLQKSGPTKTGDFTAQSAVWSVEGVQVTASGAGYPPNSTVKLSFSTPHTGSGAAGTAQTDDAGRIAYAAVSKGGSYFKTGSTLQEVTITSAGAYYREDDDLPPYKMLNEVRVIQSLPSEGEGAIIKATVNEDPKSPGFGRIESVEVVEPGEGYRIYSGPQSCRYQFYCPALLAVNALEAKVGNGALQISLGVISASSDDGKLIGFSGRFLSDKTFTDCSALHNGVYTSPYKGASGQITVEPGGKFDPKEPCCDCPCTLAAQPFVDTLIASYALDLVPCGIDSIVVEVTIDVEPDEEDPDRCPSFSTTLTLRRGYQNGVAPYWGDIFLNEDWAIGAQLECNRFTLNPRFALNISATPSFPPCGFGTPEFDNYLQISAVLPSVRDEAGERCCPAEGFEQSVTKYGATMSVTVTIVEVEEE
jgi:hypothetical protein